MKSKHMDPKKKKSQLMMGLITFLSLILIIWEMSLFRKTFISVYIPFLLFIVGGLVCFFFVRKKMDLYTQSQSNIFKQALHGMVLFGGPLMFLFMGINYYIPNSKSSSIQLKVLETGNLARGRRGCGNPYVVVMYKGFEKQLIFPCNTQMTNNDSISVSLRKGAFGFLVIDKMKLIQSPDYDINYIHEMEETQYNKILIHAEKYYSEGNIQKSIELYERAVQLRPSDSLAKIRLTEIKAHH
jgi:hypothetical protein